MQIVTVNIPRIYVDVMTKLTTQGLYPSRSELMRIAIREFIIRELELLENILNYKVPEWNYVSESSPSVIKKPVKIDMRTIRAGWPKQK
jgi:Arc/MetJ-type ribon-helix-helix transcriptional regulator